MGEKMKTTKMIFQFALGAIICIGFFILLYMLVKSEVPSANKDLLNLVVGALIGSFATVVGYFYGSSVGSANKDEIIKDLNKPVSTTPSDLPPQP